MQSSRALRLVVLVLAMPLSVAIRAQAQVDAGPNCELPDGGSVTVDGNCQGTDAVFCSSSTPSTGSLVRLPCGDFALDSGRTLHGNCNILDGIGAWCTFAPGDPCFIGDGQGGNLQFGCGVPDMGFGLGCDEISGCDAEQGFCLTPFPACLNSNTHLKVDCSAWSQALTIDCSAENGVCDPNDFTCKVGIGGACDDLLLVCNAGLTCRGGGAQLGHCVDPNAPGEGEGEGAAGEGEGEGAAGEGEGEGAVGEGEGEGAAGGGEGEGAGGEGEGEGSDPGGGIVLGGGPPDAGTVDDTTPAPSGCGCMAASPSGVLLACAALALLSARQRRARR